VNLAGWAAAAGVAAAAIAGLAGGSCAAILAARVPFRGSASRLESCPHPGHGLRGGDLIPLAGWLRLRDRCPACRAELGAWFPAAELITAGIFVALWLRFGPSPALPAFCYLAVISVALAFIDARYKRLPDALTLPSYPAAVVLLGAGAPFLPGGFRHLAGGLIGMAAALLFFVLQALIYPAAIGWGDVKLSGVLGLYLGWFGAGALLTGLLGGYLLAAAAGIGLLCTRRATRKSMLAFGPFLLVSSLAVIIAGGYRFS
jgi:leader peptidase (prepilin peptidase)/N-methyltransferase